MRLEDRVLRKGDNGENHDLLIAGVRLHIIAPPTVRLRSPGPLYRTFKAISTGEGKSPVIFLRLDADGFPSLAGLKKKFDTHESWSIFEDGGRQWITFHPTQRVEPHWIARFDRRVSRVTVFCKARPPGTGKGRPVLDPPIAYPLDQLLLMYYFARRQGLLAHAAGMVRSGKAFIFPGVSEAGKSTFSRLLRESRCGKVLSDERMIVRGINGVMHAFGTPWAGTAGIARNGSGPLAGIFFLKHGKNNRIEKLDAASAADRLLPMISIPWYDIEVVAPIIAFAKKVFAVVPAYELSFTPDHSAVDCLRNFLKKIS